MVPSRRQIYAAVRTGLVITLGITHGKPCLLQAIRDEVKEVDELTEDNALGRTILPTEVVELLQERLDLRRRTPLVKVQTPENTLTRLRVLLEIEGGCL